MDDINNAIPNIFDQAQASTATHKKNRISLYKLHFGAASFTESGGKGRHQDDVKLIGEKVFADMFVDMLSRVLVVKKSIPAAEVCEVRGQSFCLRNVRSTPAHLVYQF